MFGFIAAAFSKEKVLYKAVKNILGFYPGNIFLYRLAFRHKSASRIVGSIKSNNERLEYLGDSVISTAVAHYLFKRYPNQDEGFLTEMRSKMVSRATLNKVAAKMGLHELLNIDSKSGGFKSVDGNALEALMGAVFLDKGYRFTEKIILRRIIAVHIDMDEIERRDWNYKSKLIDWGQKERCKVHFQVQGTLLQKGKKLYRVAAMVNGQAWGEGMDQSIKAAEQIAAENAYKNKVVPYMEKQSKKGYREPLSDEMPLASKDPRTAAKPDKAEKSPDAFGEEARGFSTVSSILKRVPQEEGNRSGIDTGKSLPSASQAVVPSPDPEPASESKPEPGLPSGQKPEQTPEPESRIRVQETGKEEKKEREEAATQALPEAGLESGKETASAKEAPRKLPGEAASGLSDKVESAEETGPDQAQGSDAGKSNAETGDSGKRENAETEGGSVQVKREKPEKGREKKIMEGEGENPAETEKPLRASRRTTGKRKSTGTGQ